MTGEPAHTASKEGIKFSSERTPRLSITDLKGGVSITLRFQLCSARYTVLQTKSSRRSASTINPVTMNNKDDSHAPSINYCLARKVVNTLRFQSVTQCYEQRTVLEAPLQSIQSQQKLWTIPIYKHREAMHRTTMN